MRMRVKKWAKPELAACPYYVDLPEEKRGRWRSCFEKDAPFYVELGCGKCVATSQMTLQNRHINYLAVDISRNILGVARRNFEAVYGDEKVDNVTLTHFDIMWIDKYLCAEDRVERIYISFCNPWNQKPAHHKRRLTHTRQLLQYRHFLTPGAQIWFKTDDDPLFRASLRYFEEAGFRITYRTDDLHGSGFTPNYISEHEQFFSEQGIKIKFCIAEMEELKPETTNTENEAPEA